MILKLTEIPEHLHKYFVSADDIEIGLEPTLAEHLETMVRLFEEVKRVLKPDGLLWINYGDCYASTPNGRKAADVENDDRTFRDKPFSTVQGSLKAKDLCMIPNRLAIALQDAGWWVRSEIIWAKPNPMPESVTDRPATAHEKIFLFSKSARYNYDAKAVRQGRSSCEDANGFRGGSYCAGVPGKRVETGNLVIPKERARTPRHVGHIQHMTLDSVPSGEGRNLRNYEPAPQQVWKIATRPFSEAHFATFPPELVQRCLLASGVKPGMTVLDPFGGAGTTGLVADQMGADSILIELNPEYVEIAGKRLRAELVRVEGVNQSGDAGPLFEGVA